MKLPQRRTRFIVIPTPVSADQPPQASAPVPTAAQTLQTMHLGTPAASPRSKARPPAKRAAGQPAPAPGQTSRLAAAKVVNHSPADGAVLLEPQNHLTLAHLQAQAPLGAMVLEEQWYRLQRPTRPWSMQNVGLKKPRLRAGHTQRWTVTVVLDDGQRRRLADAMVTVMSNEAQGIGLEARTDRYGRANFLISTTTRQLDAVYVDPLHTGWPVRVAQVLAVPGGVQIAVVPIDLALPDARGTVYGKPAAGAGRSVQVAVVDTGVGPHRALKVTRGLNTTAGEPAQRFRDEDGHGSHVAGVIAAVAAGWRRGEANRVLLHAYRIFEANDPFASTFSIAAAIKDAADQGCDLVNLSIGDSMADGAVRDALAFAWSRGCVCVAATGNDGKGQVDYPARYKQAVAVSAMGLLGSWPAGAYLDWTIGPQRGQALGGLTSFAAGFSNRGAKVALTAPGVAIVSTIFGSRWGVMSGTSMATPVATGVLARRLAATPAVRNLPRDAARSAAIVQMALRAAQDLQLPAGMQGRGLAR